MREAGLGKGIKGAISKGSTEGLKEATKEAGSGGIRGIRDLSKARTGVSKEIGKAITGGIAGIGASARTGGLASKVQRLRDAEEKAGTYQVRGLNAGREKQDAAKERQVASRYKGNFDPRKVVPEDGPQPGVTSKGTFSLYSKKKRR